MHAGLSFISTELAGSLPAPCPPGWQMAREKRAMRAETLPKVQDKQEVLPVRAWTNLLRARRPSAQQ
eukprot:11166904-Alexandrium_andersonii.AAC.1